MLRLPNPGSDIDSIIRIFQEIYRVLSKRKDFGLDDMTEVLVKSNLATSSGYAGTAALALSTREDRSRDPLYNQSKAYSEIYKLLGWIHPTPTSNLTFVFTFLGAHAVEIGEGDRDFVGQCALGICYPTDVIEVAGGYHIRPFATILKTMAALDGRLSRDEMIVGPLSLADDRNATAFDAMIARLKAIRGNRNALEKAINDLSAQRKITPVTMGNYTRFPLAFMPWAGWTKKVNRTFHELTSAGQDLAAQIQTLTDIRKSDLSLLSDVQKNAFHQLGFYALMQRADFDISQAADIISAAEDAVHSAAAEMQADPQKILHSPFQQYRAQELISAFPNSIMSGDEKAGEKTFDAEAPTAPLPQLSPTVTLTSSGTVTTTDTEIKTLFESAYQTQGQDFEATIEELFTRYATVSKNVFYPLVGKMFRALGYDCEVSRHGVNAQRWDAMITDATRSIPIEIKSPGEELFLSVKAIRQAVENKVVLTSRKSHPTTWETTSLAVGYNPPNARSEVTALISDVHYAYGITVGVVDFRSLLRLVGANVLLGKIHSRQELEKLHGIIQTTELQ